MKSIKDSILPLNDLFYWSLLVATLIIIFSLGACGKRADPVLVPAYEDKAVEDTAPEEDISDHEEVEKEVDESLTDTGAPREEEREVVLAPDVPVSLRGVYTGQSIVLTWDEILNQGVKIYRVYRSSGNGFVLVGESRTPAFTDRNIEQSMIYYYRVTAVGQSEGMPSEEINISTEIE
jgi:hypothetical protein